jgi:hypothetical protein
MQLDDASTLSLATFVSGSLATAFFTWLRARRREPAENLRYEVAAAKEVNDMAIATLSQVSEELRDVTIRLDAVEAAQEASVRELTRITVLFREAVAVLRGVIDAAREGRVPELRLSRQLMDEVENRSTR